VCVCVFGELQFLCLHVCVLLTCADDIVRDGDVYAARQTCIIACRFRKHVMYFCVCVCVHVREHAYT
jgi:hypothetical protein